MEPVNPKKLKAKRYKGLLEWICDREGHESLVKDDDKQRTVEPVLARWVGFVVLVSPNTGKYIFGF